MMYKKHSRKHSKKSKNKITKTKKTKTAKTAKAAKKTTKTATTYDNTYIIVKPYFPNEDTFNLPELELEQILKKYNFNSNKYIDNIRKDDYKLIRGNHIKKTIDIDKLNPINKNVKSFIKPSLIFFNINYININTRFYGIKTLLSNVLVKEKIDIIENKSTLYYSFNNYNKNLANKYLPITFNINEIEKYKFGNTNYYIIKPVDSMSGADILYASSMEEVKNAIEYYKTHKNYRNRLYGNNVIAQEYITKPLLYWENMLGYKCHFRVPFVVSYINKKIDSFILEDGIRILTAKEPYNMNLPFKKEIHDTHIKSSGDDYFLNKDYKNLHITIKQRDAIIQEFKKISKILENIMRKDSNEWLYPEHKNGYKIFGIDFMIEDNRKLNAENLNNNLDIKLIEINYTPSFIFHNKSNTYTQSKVLFQELDKHVFSKVF